MKKGILLLVVLGIALVASLAILSSLLSEDNSSGKISQKSINIEKTAANNPRNNPEDILPDEPKVYDLPKESNGGSSSSPSESESNLQETNPELMIADSWRDFYGSVNARVGQEIRVFDNGNNLLGVFVIKEEGKYGFLHVYTSSELNLNKDSKVYFYLYPKKKFLGESALGADEITKLDFHNP